MRLSQKAQPFQTQLYADGRGDERTPYLSYASGTTLSEFQKRSLPRGLKRRKAKDKHAAKKNAHNFRCDGALEFRRTCCHVERPLLTSPIHRRTRFGDRPAGHPHRTRTRLPQNQQPASRFASALRMRLPNHTASGFQRVRSCSPLLRFSGEAEKQGETVNQSESILGQIKLERWKRRAEAGEQPKTSFPAQPRATTTTEIHSPLCSRKLNPAVAFCDCQTTKRNR
jgi:hypothetical protein